MTKYRVLFIDDDPFFRRLIKPIVEEYALCDEASDEIQGSSLLKKNHYDLVLVDMQMTQDQAGLEVLQISSKKNIPSIVLSSFNDSETIKKAYQLGAAHYLSKRHYKKSLDSTLKQFLTQKNKTPLLSKNKFFQEQLESIFSSYNLGQSLFISGETGVGKTYLVKKLYDHHFSKDQNFVHINCSEFSEELLESELFGHAKGSFTGAHTDKQGKLELAHNGLLFLDEIATMSIRMQQKLLRAIDEKEFYPVGSNKLVKSNFTLVSATCEDLFKLISQEKFRKDLYYRIAGRSIQVPSLKNRPEDFFDIVQSILSSLPRKIVLSKDALNTLSYHNWPGNIRELTKYLQNLSLQSQGYFTSEALLDFQTSQLTSQNKLLSDCAWSYIQQHGLKSFIQGLEKEVVQKSLRKHNGIITKVIKETKVSTSAFYRILNQLEV